MTAPSDNGRVIVFGLMFNLPYAGIITQFLNYLIGLRDLGWDVWYVEDSHVWPYDPEQRMIAPDPVAGVARVASVLGRFGFGDRWVYRGRIPEPTLFGPGADRLAELYAGADLALNVTGAQELRDEHATLRRLVYVQSDPFGLQVDIHNGDAWLADQLARHQTHFTFGELIGTPSCDLPTVGVTWLPTRQPVARQLWPAGPPPGNQFTTVTTWHNTVAPKRWNGVDYYWTKDREFLAVADLPRHTNASLELAIDGVPDELALLEERGWTVVGRPELTTDIDAYRDYIVGSRGEFTVARDQVVRPYTGWFSDRSAAYLGAGRPVVTQDTGFGEVLPTGEGLFAFTGINDAAAALDAINADPSRHAAAAREIAAEYFDARKVLSSLLDRCG